MIERITSYLVHPIEEEILRLYTLLQSASKSSLFAISRTRWLINRTRAEDNTLQNFQKFSEKPYIWCLPYRLKDQIPFVENCLDLIKPEHMAECLLHLNTIKAKAELAKHTKAQNEYETDIHYHKIREKAKQLIAERPHTSYELAIKIFNNGKFVEPLKYIRHSIKMAYILKPTDINRMEIKRTKKYIWY